MATEHIDKESLASIDARTIGNLYNQLKNIFDVVKDRGQLLTYFGENLEEILNVFQELDTFVKEKGTKNWAERKEALMEEAKLSKDLTKLYNEHRKEIGSTSIEIKKLDDYFKKLEKDMRTNADTVLVQNQRARDTQKLMQQRLEADKKANEMEIATLKQKKSREKLSQEEADHLKDLTNRRAQLIKAEKTLDADRAKSSQKQINDYLAMKQQGGSALESLSSTLMKKLIPQAKESTGLLGKMFDNTKQKEFGKALDGILERQTLKANNKTALQEELKAKKAFQDILAKQKISEEQLQKSMDIREEKLRKIKEIQAFADRSTSDSVKARAKEMIEANQKVADGIEKKFGEAFKAKKESESATEKKSKTQEKLDELKKGGADKLGSIKQIAKGGAKGVAAAAGKGAVGMIGDVLKGFGGLLKNIMGPLLDFAKNPIVTLITKIGEMLQAMFGMSSALQKDMNMSAQSAAEFTGQLVASSDFMNQGPDAMKSMEESFKALTDYTGSFNQDMVNTVKTVSRIKDLTGVTSEESAKFINNLGKAWHSSSVEMEDMVLSLRSDAQAAGVNFKFVMSDIAKESSRTALYSENIGQGIMRAAVNAKKMGTDLSSWTGLTDQVSDWEGAIDTAMKFNNIAGKQILDAQELYLLGLEGDVEKIQNKFVDAIKQVPKDLRTGAMGRQLAKAMGLDEESYQKMLRRLDLEEIMMPSFNKVQAQLNAKGGIMAGLMGEEKTKFEDTLAKWEEGVKKANKNVAAEMDKVQKEALISAAEASKEAGFGSPEEFKKALESGNEKAVTLYQKAVQKGLGFQSFEDMSKQLRKSLTPQDKMLGLIQELVKMIMPIVLRTLAFILKVAGTIAKGIGGLLKDAGLDGLGSVMTQIGETFTDVSESMTGMADGMEQAEKERRKQEGAGVVKQLLEATGKAQGVNLEDDQAVVKKLDEIIKNGKAEDELVILAKEQKERLDIQIKQASEQKALLGKQDQAKAILEIFKQKGMTFKSEETNAILKQFKEGKIDKLNEEQIYRIMSGFSNKEGMRQGVTWQDVGKIAKMTGEEQAKAAKAVGYSYNYNAGGMTGSGMQYNPRMARDIAFAPGSVQSVIDKKNNMWTLDPADGLVASTNFNFGKTGVTTNQPLPKGSLAVDTPLTTTGMGGGGKFHDHTKVPENIKDLLEGAAKNSKSSWVDFDPAGGTPVNVNATINTGAGQYNELGVAIAKSAVAMQQQGIKEEPDKSNNGPAVAQLLKNVGSSAPAMWCGAFAGTAAKQGAAAVGDTLPYKATASVSSYLSQAKSKNIFSDTPVPGALVVYKSAGRSHVGVVVETDGQSYVETGGNSGDKVSTKKYKVGGAKGLSGFVLPQSEKYPFKQGSVSFGLGGTKQSSDIGKTTDMAISSGDSGVFAIVDKAGNVYELTNSEGALITPNIKINDKLKGKLKSFQEKGGIYQQIPIPQMWKDKLKEIYGKDFTWGHVDEMDFGELRADKTKAKNISDILLSAIGYTPDELKAVADDRRIDRLYNELFYGINKNIKKEWRIKDIDWFSMINSGGAAGSPVAGSAPGAGAVTQLAGNLKQKIQEAGYNEALVNAVMKVESSGVGFANYDGLGNYPKLRFEPHHFNRGKPDSKKMPFTNGGRGFSKIASETGSAAYQKALSIDRDSAIKATSFGKYQIMGLNYATAGANSAEDFLNMMMTEEGQDTAFFNYTKKNKIQRTALQAQQITMDAIRRFVESYNGSTNVDAYSKKIISKLNEQGIQIADAYFGTGEVDAIMSDGKLYKPSRKDKVSVGTKLPDLPTNTKIQEGKLAEYVAKVATSQDNTNNNSSNNESLNQLLVEFRKLANLLLSSQKQAISVNMDGQKVGQGIYVDSSIQPSLSR